MLILEMTGEDFTAFWPVFKAIIRAEETYALAADMDFESARQYWTETPHKAFVARDQDGLLGSYYLKPNAAGPGDHICNCGYMVAHSARGKGVARALCKHSQEIAIQLGYLAMQFNAVVSSNTVAINLWKSLGYRLIGTIPNGYRHHDLGFVDTFIMYKDLKTA